MTLTPQTSWAEDSPAGADQIALGDNRIREMKTQLREVIAVDHEMASSGQTATTGQHKKITLQDQADLGSGATGKCFLGAQGEEGSAELTFTDEDDNDVVITDSGYIKTLSLKSSAVADMTNLMSLIYPIGYVITLGVSTNPATLLGIGTWTAITGKVIVGIDSGTFNTLDATGGAETITLTAAQSGVPAHTHGFTITTNGTDGGTSGVLAQGDANTTPPDYTGTTAANTAANAAEAHSNLQPYIVKYVWQRVS